MNVIQLPRFLLIEHTHDAPPNHIVATPYAGAGSLREATCQAIFGRKTIELDAPEREEFAALWREFWKSGRLDFEGDPGIEWAPLYEGV